MNARKPVRFSVEALREQAGEKVFARGEAYFRENRVTLLTVEPARVLAQVSGSETYRTELKGSGRKLGGSCNCPAFGDWGVCKHMVAVALAVNAGGEGGEAAGVFSRVRSFLKRQELPALVAMILEQAERDPALFRKLAIAAAVSGTAGDKDVEAQLDRALRDATHVDDFIDYGAAKAWAGGVEAVLGAIAGLVPSGRAGVTLRLAERAVERIVQTIGEVDDSDGHAGALLERAADIHLAAVEAAKPDGEALARFLFAQEMSNHHDAFFGASETYAKPLGKKGLAEYRRLALEAWNKLPRHKPRRGEGATFSTEGYRLKAVLDSFAERDGDLDARIALRAADLSSAWDYLELAGFCLEQGRQADALRWAEEGLWMFEDDRPDERLVFFAAKLLEKAGREADAEAQLRKAFEKAPSLELYDGLAKFGGKAAREKAVAVLEAKLGKGKPLAWIFPADLLVRILTAEKRFAEAWAVVRKHRVTAEARLALAQASETAHPAEALALYTEHVEQLAEGGGASAYADAAKLVARMGTLRGAAEQRAYLDDLKARFGRRRTFMKLLP